MTYTKVKTFVRVVLFMTLILEACTSTLSTPSIQTLTSGVIIETVIPTQTDGVLPLAAEITPPPTSTSVLIAFTPVPLECVRSTESAALMQAFLGDCVYWVDEYSDESGFRIELSYLNSGEYFLWLLIGFKEVR